MTLAELKKRVDDLVAKGYGDDHLVMWPEEGGDFPLGWTVVEAETRRDQDHQWTIVDIEPSGDDWSTVGFAWRRWP